jgi:type IV pilus modification protein PilV
MIETGVEMPLTQNPVNRFDLCGEKGFTLVEVLIAVSIFAVGLLAVAMMLDTAIQYNSSARFISEATEIAHSQMEKLMNSPYDDANLEEASSPYGPNPIAHYNVSWSVREDVPMAAMKTISLSVAWSNRGENKSLTIHSLKQ